MNFKQNIAYAVVDTQGIYPLPICKLGKTAAFRKGKMIKLKGEPWSIFSDLSEALEVANQSHNRENIGVVEIMVTYSMIMPTKVVMKNLKPRNRSKAK